MADPIITPLAAFGLATTILNYLISTAQNLHGKYHEIKDFPEVFRRYGHTVYECLQGYDLWLRVWHRPNEASYNELFGIQGWMAIRSCREDVERLILETADILRLRVPVSPPKIKESIAPTRICFSRGRLRKHQPAGNLREVPISLEPGDPLKWQVFTDALEGFLTTYKPEELVLKRIVGILGPNQNLKNKIAGLEKAVASLAKRTNNAFQLMGHGKDPREPSEVDVADNTIKFRAVARNMMRLTRNQALANVETRAWFLQLGFPSTACDGSVAAAQIIQNCRISFVVRTSLPDRSIVAREINLERLRGLLENEVTDISELENAMANFHKKSTWTVSMPGQPAPPVYQLDWSDTPPSLFMKDWRSILGACSRNQGMRKAMELERARFTLGLTLWFILLWETEWFSHVCSCAFRCVLFFPQTGGERRDSATVTDDNDELGNRQEHVYAVSQFDSSHNDSHEIPEVEAPHQNSTAVPPASCRGEADLKHRLYHLGMLLAELALATPIYLSSDLDQVPRTNSPGWPVGQFCRIREIKNHHDIPTQLKEAIGFCFDKSTDEQWSAETKGLAAHRVNDFLEGVVKPVKQYYDTVQQNFKYAKQFMRVAQDYQDDNYKL